MLYLKVFWLALAASVFFEGVAPAAQVRTIRIASGREGSSINASLVGVSAVLNPKLKAKGLKIEPTTVPGSTASIRMLNRGEVDFAFASTMDLRDAYTGQGAFSKGSAMKVLPLQGIYYANVNIVPCVKPDSKLKTFRDMEGSKFYPFDAASSIFQIYKVLLTELGIWDTMQIRQLASMEVADAMTMGTLEVAGTHASSNGLAAVAWIRNLDAASGLRFLQPTEEEKQIMSKVPGITFKYIDTGWVSEKNRQFNPEKIWTATVHYALYPSSALPEDVVYEISKAFAENSAEYVHITTLMKAYHNDGDPLEWTRVGISEGGDIPVHPGLVQYLKERNAWDPSWPQVSSKH